MNAQARRRLLVVVGVIVVVAVVAFAMIGSMSTASAVTVKDLAAGNVAAGQKIQVSGSVVDGSATTDDQGISFAIADPDDEAQTLAVRYEGAASSTFGNGVTAICTGRVDDNGVLQANELVTKCPSKYESATDALTVAGLLDYGDQIIGKPVKVTGYIVDGIVNPIDAAYRFKFDDGTGSDADGLTPELEVRYAGAMPETIEGAYVLTGALTDAGVFEATDVAQAN